MCRSLSLHSAITYSFCHRCLGSTQHLKDRHGSSYVLEVKLRHCTGLEEEDDYQHTEFCAAVENLFPGASLVESFGDRVTFKITQESVRSLSRVFAWFEEGRHGSNFSWFEHVIFTIYKT